MRNRYLGGVASCSVLLTCFSSAAWAQEADGNAADSSQLQDIVVTARRTSEKLQSTPVAVTAINEAGLARQQVLDITDLQRTAPSLNIGSGASTGGGFVFVAIRGQAQNSPTSASDPAVGIYIDGVYQARASASLLDLVDVNRVEVLRGPQGTLFGRNTVGGALSLTTNQPNGTFSGSLQVGAGNYDQRKVRAVVNLPLHGDELAARFAFQYSEHGGYGRNVVLNRPAGDNRGNYVGRAQIRIAPDALPVKLTLSADYNRFSDSGQVQVPTGFNPNIALGGGLTLGAAAAARGFNPALYLPLTKENFRTTYGSVPTNQPGFSPYGSTTWAKGLSATLEADLGGETRFRSITAYRESGFRSAGDTDGLPINLSVVSSDVSQHQISEEAQLFGKIGNLDWIGGIFYFNEKAFSVTPAASFGFLNPAAAVSGGGANVDHSSFAAFAQFNYHLTDKLRATAGIRYTWDKRIAILHNLTNRALGPDVLISGRTNCTVIRDVPGGPCNQTLTAKFDYPAYTLGLDYQANDNLFLYAKTGGASMAGGWNLRIGSVPAFQPESVRDVEAGLKADFLDRRLRTNLALFYAWQNKVQRIKNAIVNGSLTQFVTNAGKAHVKGAELEVTALPWTGMELTGNLGLLDANYVSGTFLDARNVGGTVVTFDRSGEPIPQAPKATFSFGATQKVVLPIGDLFLHVDYYHVSKRVFFADTAAPGQTAQQIADIAISNSLGVLSGYGIANAKVDLRIKDSGIELSAWVRNLTNKRYFTNLNNFYTSLGAANAYAAPPRTYGVVASYRW